MDVLKNRRKGIALDEILAIAAALGVGAVMVAVGVKQFT